MSRVKGGMHALKRRRNVLAQTKGYRNARKSKERQAHEAIVHAGNHAFAHRRDKKNVMRRLWQVRMGAALKSLGWSYSKFIGAQKKANVELDRKVLSQIAQESPETFAKIVEQVKA